MSENSKSVVENKNLSVSEILLGLLLGVVSVSILWISTSLMLYLFTNL